MSKSIISGTGSAIPDVVVPNSHFLEHEFYDSTGVRIDKPAAEIISKLESITGIRERRYIPANQDSVRLMTDAAMAALDDANLKPNQLSGIIVAHNAGNMITEAKAFHTVPNLASCLKNSLECTEFQCFAFDILFGCPGWLQAMIQAHQTIQMGDAEHVLVVGLEVASRMLDPHDVDSMILGDGCGACVVSRSDDGAAGIVAYSTYSHGQGDNRIIYLGSSNKAGVEGSTYFHMIGREVYRYATEWVPKVVKKALDTAGREISEIDIFFFHQANAKLNQAITRNLAGLYNVSEDIFACKVPSTIEFLGNTSVATIPTMLDLVAKRRLGDFHVAAGHLAVFASVGAGMHCNALVYQF